MKTLKDFDVENKRVLVRCDFNVPLDERGDIEDDFRIEQTVPTIKYLINGGAKIILMSHLGNPKGEVVESLRLISIQKKLAEYLGFPVIKTSDCIGEEIEKQVLKLKRGEILLLENLRFHKEEEENDSEFVKGLAKLGDIYINDAFGVSHRKHASIVGIPEHLPSGVGFLFEKEIKILSKVLEKPERPLTVIIGGAKIANKAKFIKDFFKKADYLLIGGKIANTILVVRGVCISKLWPAKEIVKEVNGLDLTSTKLHLPVDAIVSADAEGAHVKESALGKVKKEELILDIGPETIKVFSKVIERAKTIVWSGPVGFFEKKAFEKGTKRVAEEIAKNREAYKIIGGGDTIYTVSKFGLRDKFNHISTGGGAMLNFLSGEELPGLKALEESKKR